MLALVAFTGAACSNGDEGPPAVVVRVFAGAPLQDVFEDLGEAFTALHADVRVDFTFAEPAALLRQVEQGRAAAVLATSDAATMDEAEAGGMVRHRFEFATMDDGARVFEITVLSTAVAPTEARQLVDFVRGVQGRAILVEHDFEVG